MVRRALDVNDKKKVYLQLINIYRTSNKTEYVEDIYKKLCKKYRSSLEMWSSYLEFLFDSRDSPESETQFTQPKAIL